MSTRAGSLLLLAAACGTNTDAAPRPEPSGRTLTSVRVPAESWFTDDPRRLALDPGAGYVAFRGSNRGRGAGGFLIEYAGGDLELRFRLLVERSSFRGRVAVGMCPALTGGRERQAFSVRADFEAAAGSERPAVRAFPPGDTPSTFAPGLPMLVTMRLRTGTGASSARFECRIVDALRGRQLDRHLAIAIAPPGPGSYFVGVLSGRLVAIEPSPPVSGAFELRALRAEPGRVRVLPERKRELRPRDQLARDLDPIRLLSGADALLRREGAASWPLAYDLCDKAVSIWAALARTEVPLAQRRSELEARFGQQRLRRAAYFDALGTIADLPPATRIPAPPASLDERRAAAARAAFSHLVRARATEDEGRRLAELRRAFELSGSRDLLLEIAKRDPSEDSRAALVSHSERRPWDLRAKLALLDVLARIDPAAAGDVAYDLVRRGWCRPFAAGGRQWISEGDVAAMRAAALRGLVASLRETGALWVRDARVPDAWWRVD